VDIMLNPLLLLGLSGTLSDNYISLIQCLFNIIPTLFFRSSLFLSPIIGDLYFKTEKVWKLEFRSKTLF